VAFAALLLSTQLPPSGITPAIQLQGLPPPLARPAYDIPLPCSAAWLLFTLSNVASCGMVGVCHQPPLGKRAGQRKYLWHSVAYLLCKPNPSASLT
jgi:hypothetical protein